MKKTEKLVRGVRRNPGQAGMTLMEIMIVLAILALVMGFLFGPAVFEQFSSARAKTAKLMAKDYVNAYGMWIADNPSASCPDELSDLQKYRNKKDDKDPWGKEFVMLCGDDAPDEIEFGVVSPGPNGSEGDEDDIKSWEEPE